MLYILYPDQSEYAVPDRVYSIGAFALSILYQDRALYSYQYTVCDSSMLYSDRVYSIGFEYTVLVVDGVVETDVVVVETSVVVSEKQQLFGILMRSKS